MNTVLNFIFYFFIYSFTGWILEVLVRLTLEKKLVNKGFLVGPICPIYGYSMVLLVLLVGTGDKDILSIFLKTVFVCTTIEYLTSYFMEKIFKARWWDYSHHKFNLNGRVCLRVMAEFGIMGTIALYFVQPKLHDFVGIFSFKIKLIVCLLLLLMYIMDTILSFKVMKRIKSQIKRQKGDNTEEVRSQVTEWINENSFLYKHIIRAFPNFTIRVKKLLTKKDVNKE